VLERDTMIRTAKCSKRPRVTIEFKAEVSFLQIKLYRKEQ